MKLRTSVQRVFFAAFLLCAASVAAFSQVVISHVYGGGGNTGATYKNDFIEIFNRGAAAVDLTGYSVQYASSTGTAWQVTALTSVNLQPGQYYLVQQAAGAGGTTNLPTADKVGTSNMSGTTGKVLLSSSTTAFAVACPSGGTVLDLVGFGSGANCSETSPVATLSNTTAGVRASAGCTDAGNNSTDFSATTVNPRNTATTLNTCGGGGGVYKPRHHGFRFGEPDAPWQRHHFDGHQYARDHSDVGEFYQYVQPDGDWRDQPHHPAGQLQRPFERDPRHLFDLLHSH